jgi:RNA polymerase sigma factor (sigma-70 family)
MSDKNCAPEPSVLRTRGFDAFYRTYYAQIVRYFQRELGDTHLAFDLAQETFTSAFEARETFRGSVAQQERAWLWMIATNHKRGHWRTSYTYRAALGRLAPSMASDDTDLERIDEVDSVERLFLPELVQSLRPLYRQAIEMRFRDGLDYKTMGERLYEQPDTMRVRVNRALQELRRKLDSGHGAR